MKSSLEWFGLVACFGLLSLYGATAAEEEKYPERNGVRSRRDRRKPSAARSPSALVSRFNRPSIGPVPAIASRCYPAPTARR